jgi:bacterial/archaeal transporter family-2 protein
MGKIIWIIFSLLAGSFIAVQGGLNALVGKEIKSPIHASLISFIVGTICILIYMLLTRQTVSFDNVRNVPWYAWCAGMFGAFSLTVIILALPRIGPGLTFGLLVAGQMIISVALEHFNILVAQPHPISVLRVVGILLIVGGVALIRIF